MKQSPFWPLVWMLLLAPQLGLSAPKTLFEGYYKILSGGQHVGYYIQRYELNPKSKQFVSTYYLRTNAAGGNISESLKAYSTDKLNPIKYQYTSLQGKVAKTIDANVRKDKRDDSILQVKVNENGELRVYEKKLEEGTFFSTFLIYLLLQGEKGITPGAKYNFRAVAEEDGKAFPGEVYVDSETKKLGVDVYKVLYTFKRTQFVNFITQMGESIISVSPALQIAAEMVTDPSQATAGMPYNEKSLALLFGDLPKGTKHSLKAQGTPPSVTSQKLAPDAEEKNKTPTREKKGQ
jgi:hypothetical protein